jgi:hypothetical protein
MNCLRLLSALGASFWLLNFYITPAKALVVSGRGTWETTLQARDLDGNLSTAEAYYDTDLGITWLVDANYAQTSGYDANGWMDWGTATTWVAGLNPYGSGITGWRLPTTIDADGPDADALGNDGCDLTPSVYQGLDCGYNITAYSEMSHMFYVTLGDKAYYSTSGTVQPGWGVLANTGPFRNVQANVYWSATEYAPDIRYAWSFYLGYGYQYPNYKMAPGNGSLYAWAVHSGDVGAAVSTVPLTSAVWLFGSGLLGLIGIARRKKAP